MDLLAKAIAAATRDLRFPARLRAFAASGMEGHLATLGLEPEWVGPAPLALAAACGAARAEAMRGGAVLVLVPSAVDRVGLLGEALALGNVLCLPLLYVMVSPPGTSAQAEQYALNSLSLSGWMMAGVHGKQWADPEQWFTARRATVVGVVAESGDADGSGLRPDVSPHAQRAEWQPVELPGLRAWAAAQPACDGDLGAWLDGCLARLAAQHPRLLLVHAEEPWRSAAVTAATAFAAAQHAGEGRRVVWRLPRGTDLLAWLSTLRAIGARGLALKLLVDADDLPPLCHWAGLPGWWVSAPLATGELLAVLAGALDDESCAVVAVPRAACGAPWPAGVDAMPGAARWLLDGPPPTLVCDQRSAELALGAAEALAAAGRRPGVLLCASLVPLPAHALRAAAAAGPLVVVDAGPSASGLGWAVSAALAGEPARIIAIGAQAGCAPTVSEVAQAVREA